MGVFKWLRRERVTVSAGHMTTISPDDPDMQAGTAVRTEEYERALAEFRARRSSLSEDRDTPDKKKNGRHSIPVSCTSCAGDPDKSFNYEKKSANKYKTKLCRRARSAQPDHEVCDVTPNIQFLFQKQVFMPGRVLPASYSEPVRSRRQRVRSANALHRTRIEFDDDRPTPPYIKNNSLPLDVKDVLEDRSYSEEVDGARDETGRGVGSAEGRRCDDTLLQAIKELKMFDRWADEQLVATSADGATPEETESTTSTFGVTVASACDLDVTGQRDKVWSDGKWGVVPVMMKKMAGVSVEHVRRKLCPEINMLRRYRHPNIILLMGLYPDARGDVHMICERCVDSVHNLIHIEGVILSLQTSLRYASDVADALVFLRMQGFVHTELSSAVVMITVQHTAKLADLGACAPVVARPEKSPTYSVYTPEPHYVNLPGSHKCNAVEEWEPLLSGRPSEAELGAAPRPYAPYARSPSYRWQAPELFAPDDDGRVRPCSRSDVYSLCMLLWECCNATMPWKCLSYESLKEQYTVGRRGMVLPQDGTYPGSVLALLRGGLQLERARRPDLLTVQETLHAAKKNIDEMEYIVIPARRADDDNATSPRRRIGTPARAAHDTSTESDKETNSNPGYETIPRTKLKYTAEKSFTSDDDDYDPKQVKYKYFDEKNYSSACSTPVHKMRAKVLDVETPGAMQRSDSTEYCSIMSPDGRLTGVGLGDASGAEHAAAKLSRSFTPQSYKPLHIQVPDYNLDSVKSILRNQTKMERSSYKFDINNCSLPSMPIARSNQLRKNAWLAGSGGGAGAASCVRTGAETEEEAKEPADRKAAAAERASRGRAASRSAETVSPTRDCFTGLRRVNDPPHEFLLPGVEPAPLERTRSLNSVEMAPKYKMEEDILATVNVKPLVAIHERWIHEANKKTGRSLSLPEPGESTGPRAHVNAVKPASHCVDSLQRTQPPCRAAEPASAAAHHDGNLWEKYYQTREAISKNLIFHPSHTKVIRKLEKSTATDAGAEASQKMDRSTDTREIEEYIRDLIRKEITHLLGEMSDNTSDVTSDTPSGHRREDDVVSRGVANVLESLKSTDDAGHRRDAATLSYSRIKINGNNKPLVQITFSRSGDNRLEVLDERVEVTAAPTDGAHHHALKRCQAFSAIQEARSTEDLYIDDDLSTHMQENFGGKVKLIPLHGSLHEILCEKEDDCCLIKVKQENGCDTIYFRCDNSDTESRDAIDGQQNKTKDTVVFKRSISLIEERVQRVVTKDKRLSATALKKLSDKLRGRPKSEVLYKTIDKDSRALSSSTPSLSIKEDKSDEVESVYIENVLCYQDSSSEECLRYADDDFEMLERAIEEDLANHSSSLTCGCLEKISEENLSIMNEDY